MAALLLVPLVSGCKSSSEGPDRSPPSRPSTEASAAGAASAPAAGTGLAAGAASSGSASSAEAMGASPEGTAKSPLAGAWRGSYDAKKGSVEMPAKVKDKPRASDDGKAMAGPGKVELEVAADGNVRGKASGALGEATLSGKLDDAAGVLRASWFPVDPSAPNAMTGVLIGLIKEGAIQAEIRVAGPDATLVREAKIELKRN